VKCGKTPEELPEYVEAAKEKEYVDAEDYVVSEEGTYNPRCGLFYCTECYVEDATWRGKELI
jgi:hypothetical protein